MYHHIKPCLKGFVLFLILLTTSYVYLPGTSGAFIFDDFANLETLGDNGSINDLASAKAFITSGHSGPLGRPLSLATFLLDDNTWPSAPKHFKETNIKIHLVCGLLFCWLLLFLFRLFRFEESRAQWLAIAAAALWMLHPLMVSTTLYVIQRMAQLSTLFTFAGMCSYLYGRLLLERDQSVRKAYLWMSIGLPLFTALAVFSKENGILLPIMVIVVEWLIPKKKSLSLYWMALFFGVPLAGFLVLMYREVNLAPHPWTNRPFNQSERFLTEFRILWEYIYLLFVPQIEGRGLFQDGFPFSRGVLNPISTLFAIVAFVILIVGAIFCRKRYPLISVSILLFITSHLLESTHLGLELYFEHRNYMGGGFLLIPIVLFVNWLSTRYSLLLSVLSIAFIVAVLAFMTHQRATLWGKPWALERYWALAAPDSPRAQNKLAYYYLKDGNLEKSLIHLQDSLKRFPNSSLLAFNYLVMKIDNNIATKKDFTFIAEIVKKQPLDAQTVMGSKNLVDVVLYHGNRAGYVDMAIQFFEDVNAEPKYRDNFQYQKIYTYQLGRMYLSLESFDEAYDYFSMAIATHKDADAAMNMVALMANASRPIEASMLLTETEFLLSTNKTVIYNRSPEFYQHEIVRIRAILKSDLDALGVSELNLKSAKSDQ